jgi:hypothetical protein
MARLLRIRLKHTELRCTVGNLLSGVRVVVVVGLVLGVGVLVLLQGPLPRTKA